jgi:hypothetical protein
MSVSVFKLKAMKPTVPLNAYTSAAMRFIFIYALLCFAERSSREGHSQIDEIARRRHAVISSKMDGDCLGDARCLFSRS